MVLQRRRVGLASPADAAQLLAEGGAVPCPLGEDLGFREDAHGGAAAHHRRREAGAFLVGPVDQQQRRFGLGAGLVQGAHDLKAGEHAEHAVELATRGLRVEMAADRDRRARRVAALAAEHHVAEAVHARASGRSTSPQRRRRWRPSPSRSVSAWRSQPPFGSAPMRAISIRLSQSRWPESGRLRLVFMRRLRSCRRSPPGRRRAGTRSPRPWKARRLRRPGGARWCRRRIA